MRMSVLRLVVFVLCSMAPVFAQTTTGSIVGTVTDPSGAVVSNAAVTVTNMDTNISTRTTTDSSGNYVVTPLPVGRYSVSVEAPGFKKSVSSNITLNVQDRVRVDSVLTVGELSDTVEVAVLTVAYRR